MLNTKILDVPYLTQPTPITCQSTCLKMYAKYLEQKLQMSSLGAEKTVQEIWKEINEDPNRPSKVRNSYDNFSCGCRSISAHDALRSRARGVWMRRSS